MSTKNVATSSQGIHKSISCIKFSKGTTSKWLDGQNERNVFCNVIETGDVCEMQIHNELPSIWSIALRPKKPDTNGNRPVEMAWLETSSPKWLINNRDQNSQQSIRRERLDIYWPTSARIRINNESDKKMEAHTEEDIRNQIIVALKDKNRKWHNSQHFAYWCRYGKKQKIPRLRQISDITKWGSIGASAGVWMYNQSSKRSNSR